MRKYLFGFQGNNFLGLNHVLLELKEFIFYYIEENERVEQLLERFTRRIMHLIIKEKMIALGADKFKAFKIKFYD